MVNRTRTTVPQCTCTAVTPYQVLVMALVVSSNYVLPEVTVALQTCIYISVLFSERGTYIDSYIQNGQIEKKCKT